MTIRAVVLLAMVGIVMWLIGHDASRTPNVAGTESGMHRADVPIAHANGSSSDLVSADSSDATTTPPPTDEDPASIAIDSTPRQPPRSGINEQLFARMMLDRLGRWSLEEIALALADERAPGELLEADFPIATEIVQQANALLEDHAGAFHRVRQEEMIELIEAGHVLPLPQAPPSMSVLRLKARSHARRSGRPDREQAEAEYLDYYMNNPPIVLHDNGMVHGGQAYAMTDFRSLPRTGGALARAKEAAFPYLEALCVLLVRHGALSDVQALRVLECFLAIDVQSMSTRPFRELTRPTGR